MINIEIWASGKGSNAQKIIRYFKDHSRIRVVRVASNRQDAGVLGIAAQENIPGVIIETSAFRDGTYLREMQKNKIDYVILAGFLKLVPADIVAAYHKRMINLHPSLLPKYGGKNMYGDHVHEAVLKAGERESGITIHHVNEEFDKGEILAQFKVQIAPDETTESLREKIHQLEHLHFAEVIEGFIDGETLRP